MSAAAAGAHAHAGGPGAGAAQAAPVLDMSRHKAGIVPVVQCVRASAARHPSLLSLALSPSAGRSVAATAELGCQVDLMTIALRGRCVEYDSKARQQRLRSRRLGHL